jgi:hypothetical protein
MPQVGVEPTTPVFERAKTVHALDRAATVISHIWDTLTPYSKREQYSVYVHMRVDNEGYLKVGALDSNYFVGKHFLSCRTFLPVMLCFLGRISKNWIYVLHSRQYSWMKPACSPMETIQKCRSIVLRVGWKEELLNKYKVYYYACWITKWICSGSNLTFAPCTRTGRLP